MLGIPRQEYAFLHRDTASKVCLCGACGITIPGSVFDAILTGGSRGCPGCNVILGAITTGFTSRCQHCKKLFVDISTWGRRQHYCDTECKESAGAMRLWNTLFPDKEMG